MPTTEPAGAALPREVRSLLPEAVAPRRRIDMSLEPGAELPVPDVCLSR